jgi:hypothetical protein
LAGATPEEVVDAFVDRIRTTLDCITAGTAFGSGIVVGFDHSVTLYSPGQAEPNIIRLATHGGVGELLFRFAHLYNVVQIPGAMSRARFDVRTSFYQYRILDVAEKEIVVYDWAPVGRSPVRTPHLHIPAAGSIVLAQRAGSRPTARKTYLGDLHFPTGHILLEDIVELLIREFGVGSRRADWEEVLRSNREAVSRHGSSSQQ